MTTKIVKITQYALIVGVFFGFTLSVQASRAWAAPTDPSGGVLTNAEQKQCKQDWNGDSYNLSKAGQNDKFKQFKQSDCYQGNDKGGYCDFTLRTDHDPESPTFKKTFADIKCAADTGDGGGGGTTTTAGDDVADPAFSQDCTEDTGSDNCDLVARYINPFIKLLSVLVGIVAVIFIIFGAIQVSTSAGDPQKSANGKEHIRNALIGLVAYVLLFAFLNFLVPGGIT